MARITGTQDDDPFLDGTEDDDQIFGLGGADDIFGNGGDDRLLGGRGDDMLRGGDGIDTLIGGRGKDQLFGDSGSDVLDGGAGDDRLRGGLGIDSLRGGAGEDDLVGGRGNDELLGGDGADRLFGDQGDDRLFGDAGPDRLLGRGGTDLLDGGAGNDRYDLDGDQHQIVETALGGHDRVRVAMDYTLPEFVEDLEILGDARVGIGNQLDNVITGNRLANRLVGGEGRDRLLGQAGADVLEGGDGKDRLLGGDGADRLEGGKRDDTLEGGKGADRLIGGRHDDVLIGGRGDDILIGGSGSDRFVIAELSDGLDTVKDFRPGQGDILDLSQLLSRLGRGDDLSDFVEVGVERGNTLVGVNINGRGENFKLMAVLEGIELDSLTPAQLGLPEGTLPDQLTLVSRTADGEPGNDTSFAPTISGDGRFVVFWSDAGDLSNLDGDGRDVLIADLAEGSVLPLAEQSVLGRNSPQISDDGRFVAFASDDSRLTDAGEVGLFLLDRETGEATRIPALDDNPARPTVLDLSANGRFVTYDDPAADGGHRLFRFDSQSGDVIRVDDDSTALFGSGSISADGNLVAFTGEGAVRNVATGEIVVTADQINFFEGFTPPDGFLAADGRSLFFDSPVDLDAGHRDVWVLDIADGTLEEVSTSVVGESGNADSFFLGASANGRFVALRSGASNLVEGDDEGSFDLLVKDLLTGEVALVAEGGPPGTLQVGSISADGSAVAYAARGDNGEYQIFWAPTGLEGGDLGVEKVGGEIASQLLDQLLIELPDVA